MDDSSKFQIRIPDDPVKPVNTTISAIRAAVVKIREERLRKDALGRARKQQGRPAPPR